MGEIYSITCRSKACGYHVELRKGSGMGLFREMRHLEKDIISGETEAPEDIKELLRAGRRMECVTTYICPVCREWKTYNSPYIFEATHVSPYGTIKDYRLHYLYGKPKCDKCGTELIFLLNPLSGKNKCPKCGEGGLRARISGNYD